MKRYRIKKILVSIFLLLTVLAKADSKITSDIEDVIIANSIVISNGDSVKVSGNRYGTSLGNTVLTRDYFTERAYGLIKIYSPELYQSAAIGEITVELSIYYEKIDEDGMKVPFNESKTLKLEAGADKVIDIAYYKAEGAELIRARVESITTSSGQTWSDVYLEANIITESFDKMDISMPNVNLGHEGTLNSAGNLIVSWDSLPGAESYDLEWTYVSNQGATENIVLLPQNIEVDKFLFRNNSSRVEVKGNGYEIPLMYERGYILYRLRGNGKRIVNGITVNTKSEWTIKDGAYEKLDGHPSDNMFLYDGLENNLNWQSTLAFAEEGKNKTLVAYHDGSLRSRQTVTRVNTDQRSSVGEVLYDYTGRSVINMMQVPVVDNSLHYYKNFNLIDGETMLLKEDYSISAQGEGCNVFTPVFDQSTGASQYYSPENPFNPISPDRNSENNVGDEMINRNLLPDAKKYPYGQTKFTPDNTGRVAAQGGVGQAHQLASDHEVKYIYGSAQQEELSRLFGNQVGYFLHYKKDLTVDANGQVSVLYKNMGGKVIASTLMGAPPKNLDELAGESRSVVNNLFGGAISPNLLGVDGISKSYVNKFTVAEDNTYNYEYNATVPYHNVFCFPFISTFQGAVDVDIKLLDGCGEVLFSVNDNTNAGNSSSNQSITATEVVDLKQGEYVLSKDFRINEEKLEAYWQGYLGSSPDCIKILDTIRTEVLSELDLFGCELTCELCEEEMNNRVNDPNADYSDEEKAAILKLCDGICDKEVGCTAHLNMMLGDFSPGGQYGKVRAEKLEVKDEVKPHLDDNGDLVVDEVDIEIKTPKLDEDDGVTVDGENTDDNKYNPSIYELSIFNEFNNLPLSIYTRPLAGPGDYRATWQRPIKIEVSGYADDKSINEVLKSDESLEGATLSLTDYHDLNGDTVYAYTTKSLITIILPIIGPIQIAVYNPAITDVSELILYNEQDSLYRIPIKYLRFAEDFNKFWQPHFARYLIPYHPEYGYLVDCSENYRESNDFDYKLSKTLTVALAIENDFLLNDSPNIIKDNAANSLDPFLNASVANYDFLKMRNDDFADGYSMAEFATNAANCSKVGLDPTCPILNCYDGVIDTDEEWVIYKSYYLSEKQRLIKELATQRSVDNFYFNACIGEKEFANHPKNQRFLLKSYDYSPITQSECERGEVDTEGIQEWSCTDKVKNNIFFFIGKTFTIYDPRQVCNINRASMFQDKTKRFFLDDGTEGFPLNCEDESESGGETTVVPRACDAVLIEAVNESIKEAQRYRYVSCGVCPLADDLDNFIFELMRNEKLISPVETHLTCSGDTVSLTGELYRLLAETNTDISWTSTVSPDGKTLNGKFVYGGVGNPDVNLTLTIPATPALATFNNLTKLCCLEVTPSIPAPNTGKVFSLHGAYLPFPFNVAFDVTGSIDFDARLDTCTITPRCLVTAEAENITSFLNMLAFTGLDGAGSDLDTDGSTLELMPEPLFPENGSDPNQARAIRKETYRGVVRSLLRKDIVVDGEDYVMDSTLSKYYKPKWNAENSGSTLLEGVFTYTENSITYNRPIELTSATSVNFKEILGFSRIHPFPGAGNENKFYVDALISMGEVPSENVYVQITVESDWYITTACYTPEPPNLNN